MHLVSSVEVTSSGPRWAPAPRTVVIPESTRAIAVGLERTTVIVIEGRDGIRSTPGEVLRMRHVGIVRLIASDGLVLARRRLASSNGHGDALIAHLLDEVRAAVAAAPHLVVGLVQDAGDTTWANLEEGLRRLSDEGVVGTVCEAIDRGALRARLDRTLCVIEPDALAREDRLDHWDACLDAWDDAIDGVSAFLRAHRELATHPALIDAQVRFLDEHREKMRYAAIARDGLCLRSARDESGQLRARIPRERER
jgi:hypothetical protein